MKKTIPLFLVAILSIFVLAGCGEKNGTKDSYSLQNNQEQPSVSQETNKASDNNRQIQQERKFVALGSSLSVSTNFAPDKREDWADWSFSTGTEVNSVYKYLSSSKGENLTPKNLASSGADTKEILEKQAVNIPSFHPKYITLDPGADILKNSVGDFQTNLERIFSKIQGEDTKIMILTYPDFIKMRTASYPSCKEDKFGYGVKNITAAKIQTFNQAIKEISAKHNITVVDLYPALGPEDVSELDCFHPNLEGINKIAQEFIKTLDQ